MKRLFFTSIFAIFVFFVTSVFPQEKIPVWKTVNFVQKSEILSKSGGYDFMYFAKEILKNYRFKNETGEVSFAKVSLKDLHLEPGAPYHDIVQRGIELGLKPCLPEDAFHLRLAYMDQPDQEYLALMTDVIQWEDTRNFLIIGRNGTSFWINAEGAESIDRLKVFIFRL